MISNLSRSPKTYIFIKTYTYHKYLNHLIEILPKFKHHPQKHNFCVEQKFETNCNFGCIKSVRHHNVVHEHGGGYIWNHYTGIYLFIKTLTLNMYNWMLLSPLTDSRTWGVLFFIFCSTSRTLILELGVLVFLGNTSRKFSCIFY